MKQYSGEIESVDDLKKLVRSAESNPIKLTNAFQYYRGHGKSTYKLTSYASRFFGDTITMQKNEVHLISDLKKRILEVGRGEYIYMPDDLNGFNNVWYLLTQAQHLAIPTRFLDWSLSSEVALYFAVSKLSEIVQDGDFWVFFIPDHLNINLEQNLSTINVFETKKDFFVNIPVQWSINFQTNQAQRNMLSQQGKFLLRPRDNSFTPLEEEPNFEKYLFRYRVPAKSKMKIINELKELNYTNENIYKTTDSHLKTIVDELIEIYSYKIL